MRKLMAAGLLVFLLLLVSCTPDAFSVDSVQAIAYEEGSAGQMGLALYIETSLDETQSPMHLAVSSPDGFYTWEFNTQVLDYGNRTYAGSSDICMPKGSDLPQGIWKLTITLPDGRIFDETFNVSYDRSAKSDPTEPYYGLFFSSYFDAGAHLAILNPVDNSSI